MLKKLLKKKLCPLFSLVLLLGCGKKISEAQSDPADTVLNESQELDPRFLVELVESQSLTKTHRITRNGNFRLPQKLFIKSPGRGIGKRVSVTFNQEIEDPSIFELKCTYRSRTQVDNLPFEKCVNSSGRDIGAIDPNEEFTLDANKNLELTLLNPSNTDLTVEAWFEVIWK